MEANPHAAKRRERRRASAFLQRAAEIARQSQHSATAGKLTKAEQLARLAERHAKLAVQLIDLKAALRRLAASRHEAERALEASFAAREAALKERERKLYLAELDHRHRQRHSPPLDPHADRWKERFARDGGETSD